VTNNKKSRQDDEHQNHEGVHVGINEMAGSLHKTRCHLYDTGKDGDLGGKIRNDGLLR